jgi:hypothetical protein
MLVLLHGRDMGRLQWTDNGLIADFMDNLIHEGKVTPFLVVMPSVTPFSERAGLNTFIATELPQGAVQSWNALAAPSSRALGGFSMGGGRTLLVASEHPSAYGMWLPLAAAVYDERVDSWSRTVAKSGPIIQYCGKDDQLVGLNRHLASALKTVGADSEYVELPGAHSFRFLNAGTPDLLERASRFFLAAGKGRIQTNLPLFEAHSGFWLNLHHALYEHAQRQRVAQGAKLWRPPGFAVRPEQSELSFADQKIWKTAVDFYARTWADRDLLDDEALTAVKSYLSQHEDDAVLQDESLPKGLATILNQAANIYRRAAWQEQDEENRAWLLDQAPRVRQLGPELANELSAAFDEPWPKERIRIDLVPMGGWAGAYTSTEPAPHIVLSVLDPRDQGLAGFEILFHEPSHALMGQLMSALATSAKRAGLKEPPPDLWHALLFYSVGEIVKRHFPNSTPYAFAQGLWRRAWPSYLGPIQQQWQSRLDGKRTLQEACDALVRQISEEDGARRKL